MFFLARSYRVQIEYSTVRPRCFCAAGEIAHNSQIPTSKGCEPAKLRLDLPCQRTPGRCIPSAQVGAFANVNPPSFCMMKLSMSMHALILCIHPTICVRVGWLTSVAFRFPRLRFSKPS